MEAFHRQCTVCGTAELGSRPGYERFDLVECRRCGLVFTRRIPTAKELSDFYEGTERREDLSPITRKRLFELLEGFEPYRRRGRILDVGCGTGFFLEAAKEVGWETFGTDYSEQAALACKKRGIEVKCGPLNVRDFEPHSFDVVTYFEVVEHINNHADEIEKVKKLLRPGGVLYVTTPNFDSLSRRALKDRWNVICYPEHLAYFTPKTLRGWIERSGFRTVRLESTGVSISRAKTSLGVSAERAVSSASTDEKVRRAMESRRMLQEVKRGVNRALTVLGLGDTLKGLFQFRDFERIPRVDNASSATVA